MRISTDIAPRRDGTLILRVKGVRLLFLPEETADAMIEGLKGAMDILTVGDPSAFATDIGPVIDAEARAALGKEFADVLTYLDILAFRAGVDLGRETIDKFNAVSVRWAQATGQAVDDPPSFSWDVKHLTLLSVVSCYAR